MSEMKIIRFKTESSFLKLARGEEISVALRKEEVDFYSKGECCKGIFPNKIELTLEIAEGPTKLNAEAFFEHYPELAKEFPPENLMGIKVKILKKAAL